MNSIAGALDLKIEVFAGPVWVSLAYVAVYYGLMLNLMTVKLRLHREYRERGEVFDRYFGQDRELLAADRSQLNMLEHMPIFLLLMWMHAFFVSSFEATVLGAIYTASRAAYPLLLRGRMGNDIPKRLLLITFTGYIILTIFAVRLLMILV